MIAEVLAERETDDVSAIIDGLMTHRDREWAWKNFVTTVESLIEASGAHRVIEIGGGRGPTFSREKVDALGIDYVSNDISERELGKAPEWVGKACFDVASPDAATIAPFAGQFDFAFSKMVMEHVPSYARAYANLHTILRDGGVAIAFHPVLFALPFMVNKLIPETAAQKLLTTFFPDRTDKGYPKFPAYYSGCFVSEAQREKIRALGFRDVWQVPFYGHGYYRKIPLLRDAHRILTRQLRNANIEHLAAFAFTIVRK